MQGSDTMLLTDIVLQNRYKICELIEVRPVSSIYTGYDLKNKKKVFIKELIITSYKDPYMRYQAIEQFKNEAKILFKLKHKNLPSFLDYFDHMENRYIIIEYTGGHRLNNIVEEKKGFFPDIKVIEWSLELCYVLSYLHKIKPHPVIFRDMRPQAIVISKDASLKLIDFGISKIYENNVQTRDIIKVVVQHYSPLEQHTGGTDTRSDIYSLGATMYYLATKKPPMDCIERSFQDESMRKCGEINPNVSPELERIILKSMEIDKKNRYQDIDAMINDLKGLLDLMKSKETKSSKSSFLKFMKEIEEIIDPPSSAEDTRGISSREMTETSSPPEDPTEKEIEEIITSPSSAEYTRGISSREMTETPSPPEDSTKKEEEIEEPPLLSTGEVIKNYEITELIQKSYLTRVYKCISSKRNLTLVIKEFLPDKLLNVSEEVIEKIHLHTRTLLYLDHPNLTGFHDYFIYGGRNYLVMDYIEGKNLKYYVEQRSSILSWETVIEWAIQLCEVLNYLHRRKPYPVVFRVLSPENILREETGILKLIAPGISRLYESYAKIDSNPEEKQFFSPEEFTEDVDVRSDIYCLGITIYYLLTGKMPPDAENRILHNIPLGTHLFDKDVPPEFIEIIVKAAEINKNKRFQNILQMKEALEFFMEFKLL